MHLLKTLTPALLLLLSIPGAVRAQTASKLVILPPQQPKTPIATLSEEIERAISAVGRKAEGSALKLDELMLAVECSEMSVACLQKIGVNLEADGLILAEVGGTEESPTLTLRWFDVKTGGDAGRATTPLPHDKDSRATSLRKAVRALFGIKEPTVARELTGGLKITATVPYVEILLDGQARGTAPLELRNLPARRYEVEAKLSGYSTWRGAVEVKPDEMTRFEIEMESSRARRGRAPSFLESIRSRTWLVAGLGGACMVTGVAFGAHMRAQQNELDETDGNTLEEISQMEEIRDAGDRDALVANIMFGVGGAALLTAGLLSYLDYRRARREYQAPPVTTVQVGPGSVELRVSF